MLGLGLQTEEGETTIITSPTAPDTSVAILASASLDLNDVQPGDSSPNSHKNTDSTSIQTLPHCSGLFVAVREDSHATDEAANIL